MAVKESMEEPSFAVKKVSLHKVKNGQNNSIEFVDPIYSDDQFVVVEKKENNWFMVSLSNKLYFHVIIIF